MRKEAEKHMDGNGESIISYLAVGEDMMHMVWPPQPNPARSTEDEQVMKNDLGNYVTS